MTNANAIILALSYILFAAALVLNAWRTRQTAQKMEEMMRRSIIVPEGTKVAITLVNESPGTVSVEGRLRS